MLLMLSSMNDAETEKTPINVNDIFGIGKGTEALANSFGKVLEKIPSNKLSPGMTFVIIVIISTMIFTGVFFKIDPNMASKFIPWVGGFILLLVIPFVTIEIVKEYLKLKK